MSKLVQRILLFFLKNNIIFLFSRAIAVSLSLSRVLIHHGGTGWIHKVVAEGDDVCLVRPLTKSAEKLSCIRVKGDLV